MPFALLDKTKGTTRASAFWAFIFESYFFTKLCSQAEESNLPQHQSYLTLQTSLLRQSSINLLSILVIFVSAQSSLNLPKLLSMTLYSNKHHRKQSLVGIISTGYVINNFLFIEHHLILISHHLITSFSPLLFRIGISHHISPSYYIVLPDLFLLFSLLV